MSKLLRSLFVPLLGGILFILTGCTNNGHPVAEREQLASGNPTTVGPTSKLAKYYEGTAFNTTFGFSGKLILKFTNTSPNQIEGDLTVTEPLGGSGPMTGTLQGNQLALVVAGHPYPDVASYTLTGTLNSDGSLAGTLQVPPSFALGIPRQQGRWEVSPS